MRGGAVFGILNWSLVALPGPWYAAPKEEPVRIGAAGGDSCCFAPDIKVGVASIVGV